jgi:hypothetical protein
MYDNFLKKSGNTFSGFRIMINRCFSIHFLAEIRRAVGLNSFSPELADMSTAESLIQS